MTKLTAYFGDTVHNSDDKYVTSKCIKPTDMLESNTYDNSIAGTNKTPNHPSVSEEYIKIIEDKQDNKYIKILKLNDYENSTCEFRRNKDQPKQKPCGINSIELKVNADDEADVYENDNNEASIYESLEYEVLRSKVVWYKRSVWKVLLICIISLIGITAAAQRIYVWKHNKGI